MKHNSKQFLALFMAVSMAVAPVSGVYAEDQNAAVEDTLSENKQDNDEAGQTEPEAAAGQTESEAAAGQTESSVTTDTSQEVTKEAGKNQVAVEKVQNTQEDGTAPQTEPIGEDEIFENITDISGMAGALKDGEYSVDADHFSAKLTSGGSSKVKIECQKVIVKNGKATAWINFSSSKYDKVWVKVNGTQNIYHAKPREGEAGVAFEIPVNLNSSMTFMAHTSSMSGKNIAYTINIAIPEDTVPSTPSTPDQTVITELSFKEGSELSMKEGEVQKLTPQFTPALSASETAPDMTWTSSDPKIVTVAKSGTQAEVTAVKAGTAEVTVSINNAEGTELKATCKVTVTASETENKTLTDGNYQVDVDTGNKMFKVTNCILVYTPDSFSWSGGTGKVRISCSKVTVTGGQAYATITFSSTHYQYVKANGNVYYPSSKTGSSTSFVIPVELNKNNTIVGMTTAMSAAHEIKYTIFVYIAEAAKANASTRANGKEITVIGVNGSDSSKTAAASKKLDEVAPEIIGLEYQSETKAEHAKYFKIYHYDQGITLLEIDMSKKTGRKAAGKKWKQSSDTSGLNPAEQEQAALYLNKVVKYLIVPENAEIPAGLDKEVIVVRQPADHIYAGTNKIISKIAKLGQTDKVTAVGVKKKKCKNETIKEKMEKKEIIYTGKSGKLNYKKLVKNKCDLALLSSGILPKKGSSKKAARKKMKAYQKMTEKMTLLEMPVIVDRSKDEKGKDAKKEWEKVYQVILGCEDQSAE